MDGKSIFNGRWGGLILAQSPVGYPSNTTALGHITQRMTPILGEIQLIGTCPLLPAGVKEG